jgi:hypothetical protein
MKRNTFDNRRAFSIMFFTGLILCMFMTACSPEWKTDIAWTIEGTILIDDGHDLEDAENLKVVAMFSGYDPEQFGKVIDIAVSNIDSVQDMGSYTLNIDLVDLEYEDNLIDVEYGDAISIWIWDDLDDDDYPDGFEEQLSTGVNNQERFYSLSAPPDSDYFHYGTVQFDYLGFPDCRGWVAGYRFFEDDYGATAPDNLVTEIDNGDVLTGVDLVVAVYD